MLKKELNVIKIIKGIRDIKIFIKNYLMEDKIKFNINNNKRNVIKIDSSASDGSEFDLGIDKNHFRCEHKLEHKLEHK